MNRIASFESLLKQVHAISDFISYETFIQSVLVFSQHKSEIHTHDHETQLLLTLAGNRLAHVDALKTREDFEWRMRALEKNLNNA